MKLISLLLVLTIAAMGCATTRPPASEPLVMGPDIAAEPQPQPPPPQGMSTGQIIGTVALVALLLPVFVLAYAYGGGGGGYGYGHGYTATTRIYADGTKVKTTVRSW